MNADVGRDGVARRLISRRGGEWVVRARAVRGTIWDSSLMLGHDSWRAPRRARRRVGATSRFRFGTSNRDTRVRRDDASNKHRTSSRLSSCTKALTVRVKSWVPPRVSCVSCVSSLRASRIDRTRVVPQRKARTNRIFRRRGRSLLRRGGRHVGAAALPERGVPVGHAVGLVPVAAARVAGAARGGRRGGGAGIASSIWP